MAKSESHHGASARCVPLFGQFDQARIEGVFREIQRFWRERSDPVTLLLSSQGGDAIAAIAFRNAIKAQRITLHVQVVGDAHSSAITILSSGTKRVARPGARFFFHAPEVMVTGGRYKTVELLLHVRTLDTIDEQDSAIIAALTGKTPQEIAAWKKEEKTLTAEEAKECGLIDEILKIP